MINRSNYHDVKSYLRYLEEVRQNVRATLRRRWSQIRHLLDWADETPFPQAADIRPTFPEYLKSARNDGKDEPLTVSTRKGICGTARRFFTWAKREYTGRYDSVKLNWLETLGVFERASRASNGREVYTLEEVRKLVALPTETLTEQRDQAAIAFLFLSGARDGAFTSLPIRAVDLEASRIQQMPCLGVNTKLGKSATTYLLDIPDLLDVAANWDRLVRSTLPPDALWYATLTRDGMGFTGRTKPGTGRASAVRKGLETLCCRANSLYRPPHSLRHGHAVYAIQRCKTMADLKAVSQNLMHESVITTEKIYSALPNDTVETRISALTNAQRSTVEVNAVKLMDHLVQCLLERPEAMDDLLEAFVKVLSQRLEREAVPKHSAKQMKGTSA